METSLIATRTVGVSLIVYDFQQQQPAWSGYVIKSHSNTNTSSDIYKKDRSWKEITLNRVMDASFDPPEVYPDAPTEDDLLVDVFDGFAENMPRK